jgi:hypothetical protein
MPDEQPVIKIDFLEVIRACPFACLPLVTVNFSFSLPLIK